MSKKTTIAVSEEVKAKLEKIKRDKSWDKFLLSLANKYIEDSKELIRHSKVKCKPKINVDSPNSFSLVFKDIENPKDFYIPVYTTMGFENNDLVFLSLEILDLPDQADAFYSYIGYILKQGIELDFPYIYMYFKDYEEPPEYYDFSAKVKLYLSKEGISKAFFTVDKDYEELDCLMEILRKISKKIL
ncbi:hypothetical protein [Acidianus sp. HS-5]|uniref:hypothetical protein n=1 Tax=Acidianus sp. HS-5 TaxID=2886040 RepID=UPI001F35A949|nr:hypothetical protein [Acidianus sp. HS-5]BDC18508.1 hypothetical protein HS5_13980 [Acidianus sp. HS-5]